jgi:hypothetical protein
MTKKKWWKPLTGKIAVSLPGGERLAARLLAAKMANLLNYSLAAHYPYIGHWTGDMAVLVSTAR